MLNGVPTDAAGAGAKRPLPEAPAAAPGANATFAPLEISGSVLNAANPDFISHVLKGGDAPGALKSDCDEQLLFSIDFPALVKLRELRIEGPDGSTPKTVKLFVNKTNMAFEDCEDAPATQELEFSSEAQTLPLNFVKFQSVSSLTVFVQDNQEDSDSTSISRLQLIGVPLHTTNMNDLKKQG